MAGFLYFRSGSQSNVKPDEITAWGLEYAFTTPPESRGVNQNSPSGKSGVIFADAKRLGRTVACDMANQVWRKLPTVEGRPELWLGYWKDAKPGPEDLQRPGMLNGSRVQLADDNWWTVPLVRRFDGSEFLPALPTLWDYDDQGQPVRGALLAQHAHLWELTCPYADQCLAQMDDESTEDQPQVDDAELCRTVVALLQANYVVGLPELVLLDALAHDQSMALVALLAVDWFEFLERLRSAKKNELAAEVNGSIMSAGVKVEA